MASVSAIGDCEEQIKDALLSKKSGLIKNFFDGLGEQYVGEVKSPSIKYDDEHRDRSTSFALYCAEKSLNSSNLNIENISPKRIATVISSSKSGLLSLFNGFDELKINHKSEKISSYLKSYIGSSVSEIVADNFKFEGPRLNYPSACATGLVSIIAGCNLIKDGVADVVLAGSSEASIHPLIISGFDQIKVISKEPSRPFHKNRDGFNIGEGCAVFVLESFENARKRGANIIAEISGYSFGSDAYHATAFEPSGDVIAYNIKKAIEMAEINSEDIEYINAHGTATVLNDRIETMAIKNAFGKAIYDIAVSAIKPYIGHLLGGSGSVELALSLIAQKNNFIIPTLNLDMSDPLCDLNYVPIEPIEKKYSTILKLSYGFGGHIAAMVLKKI